MDRETALQDRSTKAKGARRKANKYVSASLLKAPSHFTPPKFAAVVLVPINLIPESGMLGTHEMRFTWIGLAQSVTYLARALPRFPFPVKECSFQAGRVRVSLCCLSISTILSSFLLFHLSSPNTTDHKRPPSDISFPFEPLTPITSIITGHDHGHDPLIIKCSYN